MSGRVLKGASWVAISKLGGQFFQFAASLVLARLLTPADFGLLASVYVITGFAVLFFEMGLGASIVHLASPTDRDLSTAFWVNALGGVVFAGLLALCAPLVAAFYSEPALLWITPLVALQFTLSIGVCHKALLERELKFRFLAIVELATTVVGYGTSIAFAASGAGPIALAIGPLLQAATTSVVLWVAVPWRPHHFIDRASFRRLWKFSGGMLGANVVNYWGRNSDNLIVGRWLGATELGLYNRAYNLMLLPIQQVSQVLTRVMFPALAAMRGDHARVRAGYMKALRTITTVSTPVLVGMAATAPALVEVLWGPAWSQTAGVLQILCLAGLPQCLTVSVGWLYQSQGTTTTMFKMGIVTASLGTAAFFAGLPWGVEGVAMALLIRAWVFLPWQLHMAGRSVSLKARTVLLDNAPTVAVALAMGGLVWAVPLVTGLDRLSALTLVLQVLTGVVAYAVGMRVFRAGLLREITDLARRRSRRVS